MSGLQIAFYRALCCRAVSSSSSTRMLVSSTRKLELTKFDFTHFESHKNAYICHLKVITFQFLHMYVESHMYEGIYIGGHVPNIWLIRYVVVNVA